MFKIQDKEKDKTIKKQNNSSINRKYFSIYGYRNRLNAENE